MDAWNAAYNKAYFAFLPLGYEFANRKALEYASRKCPDDPRSIPTARKD